MWLTNLHGLNYQGGRGAAHGSQWSSKVLTCDVSANLEYLHLSSLS